MVSIKCIADVIEWYKMYPDDWKRTWFEIQKHHAEEIGCPDGVFHPLDIDAKINAAYIVLGLLYGNGDFTKTMEISRGQVRIQIVIRLLQEGY